MVSSLLFVVAKTQHYMLVQFIERSFHFKMVSSLLFVVAKCQHSIEGQDIGDTIAAERDPPPSSQSHTAHRHFSDTGRYSNARAHTHTHILYTRIVYTLRLQADLRTHAQTDRQTRQTDTHARTHNLYEVSEQTITLTSIQFMELQPWRPSPKPLIFAITECTEHIA